MLHPETSAEPGPPAWGTLVVSLVAVNRDGNAERTHLSRVRRAPDSPDLDSEFVSARSEFMSANSRLCDAAFQFRRRSVPDYVSAHTTNRPVNGESQPTAPPCATLLNVSLSRY